MNHGVKEKSFLRDELRLIWSQTWAELTRNKTFCDGKTVFKVFNACNSVLLLVPEACIFSAKYFPSNVSSVLPFRVCTTLLLQGYCKCVWSIYVFVLTEFVVLVLWGGATLMVNVFRLKLVDEAEVKYMYMFWTVKYRIHVIFETVHAFNSRKE